MAERKKQDWSPRWNPVRAARAHWLRIQALGLKVYKEGAPLHDIFMDDAPSNAKDLKLTLDDIKYLVEVDHDHESLSFQQDPLWLEADAALNEFQGE